MYVCHLFVCLFICPLSCLKNCRYKFHQIFGTHFILHFSQGTTEPWTYYVHGSVVPWPKCSILFYVLPVLWMTLCFHIMERMGQSQWWRICFIQFVMWQHQSDIRQRCLVEFASCQHREWNLPSPTASCCKIQIVTNRTVRLNIIFVHAVLRVSQIYVHSAWKLDVDMYLEGTHLHCHLLLFVARSFCRTKRYWNRTFAQL